MAKSKRKSASVKRSHVPASPPTTVFGIKSAFALLAGFNISINQASGSGTKTALDGSLEADQPTNEDLEEEQINFSCSDEEYATSPLPSSPIPISSASPPSPVPISPDPPPSLTLTVLKPLARSKDANFTPSSPIKTAHLSPVDASETVAPNVIGKEKVSTCLNPVDDTFVDIPSAAALSVQVPSVAPFPVDTSEHVAPTHTPASCAAKDAQPCSQVSAVGSEEWHTVGKRKHNSGTKRQSPPPLHVEGNPPTHHFYANNTPSNQQARHHVSKGKAPASSVDIAGTKTLQRPRSGMLTRSSFQKISNTVAGGETMARSERDGGPRSADICDPSHGVDDEVTVDIDSLISCVESTMSQNLIMPDKVCIFRVPHILRRHSEKAYTPNAFSIGPWHRHHPLMKSTEKVKLKYLKGLLSRRSASITLKGLIKSTRGIEKEARSCYAGPIDVGVEDFVRITYIMT
ncbi:hypothetical protein NC652_003409 [Populus alba x Populus x berolinensis]|nr:hypothetical protein NC652_003409 [Populus alba x Populus x berolinensis]